MTVPPAIRPAFSVVRDGMTVPQHLMGASIAIGNFDGVHRGHRAAIDAAIAQGRARGRPALALTFEPHPRSYFLPREPLFRLTPEPTKLRLLAATGLDGAVVMTFDERLAKRPAEDFLKEDLIDRFGLGGVVIGADFRFGRGRFGTPDLLREQGPHFGFEVNVIEQVKLEGRPVSSGAVRIALAAGDVTEANDLLGHSWFVEGKVVRGASRGRALGFPTANLVLDPACSLLYGIYAVRTYFNGKHYDSVASFGRRPQFDNGAPLLEVMLFDFDDDLYDKMIIVEFVDFIRPEQKFESVEALKVRMELDCAAAREILARERQRAGTL